jgi:O-antigen ligase
VLAAVAWQILSATLESEFNIDPSFVTDRLLWILDPEGRSDFSQAERLQLAEQGWRQLLASPIFGNGVGSTEFWQLRSSTHNLYLMLGSDFGVAGLLVLPFLLLAALRGQWRAAGGGAAAAVFLLFWGLLSHNVLTEFYCLVAISLIAASADRARREAIGAVAS